MKLARWRYGFVGRELRVLKDGDYFDHHDVKPFDRRRAGHDGNSLRAFHGSIAHCANYPRTFYVWQNWESRTRR